MAGADTGAAWWAGGQSGTPDFQSSYDPRSAYFNPYAFGNQGFNIPSGQGGYGGNMSPVSNAIYNQQGGQMGGQTGSNTGMPTSYGQQPSGPLGAYGQSMPQGGMDPRYFQGFQAQSMLMGQQYEQQQTAIANAIASGKSLLGGMGIPSEGGLGDLEKWAEQKSALESQTIKKNKEGAERTIEDQWARKGSALGSEHDRNIAEVEGASLAAMRSSSISAAIDAFMRRPQLLAQLISASR